MELQERRDCNDQIRRADGVQQEDVPALRSGSAAVVAQEQGCLAHEYDWVRLPPLIQTICAGEPDEERYWKERFGGKLPPPVWENRKETRSAQRERKDSVEIFIEKRNANNEVRERGETIHGIELILEKYKGWYQHTESSDKREEKNEEQSKDGRSRARDTKAGSPISGSERRCHPQQNVERSAQIKQTYRISHKNTQNDQILQNPKVAVSAQSASPNLASRSETEARSGKESNHDEPGAPSASISDQFDYGFTQLPHPLVTLRIAAIIIGLALSYAVLGLSLFSMLTRYIYPNPSYLIASGCVGKEMFDLYVRINQVWFTESLDAYSGSLVLSCMVRYQSLIFMISYWGPTCSITLIWLVPMVAKLIRAVFWMWRWPGMEEQIDRLFFHWYSQPSIACIQGPFTQRSVKTFQATGLHSFSVKDKSWYPALVWDLGVEIVRHGFLYIALFSKDSLLSRAMAFVLACFVWSRFCPLPQAVEYAKSVQQLIVRAQNDSMDSGPVYCSPSRECFDH